VRGAVILLRRQEGFMAHPKDRRTGGDDNARGAGRYESQGSHTNGRSEERNPRDQNTHKEDDVDLVEKFTVLQGTLSDAEETADAIAQMLRERGYPVGNLPRPTAGKATRAKGPRVTDSFWKKLAPPEVGRVSIGVVANQKVPISIDGAKAFPLTPAAADLLAVFLAIRDRDEDGFPVPRTARELAAAYSALRARPESERAVVEGISRLREQLMMRGNISPLLIETVPNRGVRLRIRLRKQ
jgi:hypothetical protein